MPDKFKILIVDDNTETIEFLDTTLTALGYLTKTSSSGTDALVEAVEYKPDLILMDYDMPGMNGIEVCKELKKKDQFKFVPVIMMTGQTDSGMLVRSLEGGASEFVAKPFDVIELSARIKAMLRTKALEDKLENINRELEAKVKLKTEKIQTLYMETVKSLAKALDAKDKYTHSHSNNVAKYSKAIADELGMDTEDVQKVESAAQLHDIGKIGIKDSILNKTERLSDSEWKEIQTHSKRSADILEPLEQLNGVVEMVRQHHERMDGTGYPLGKKAEGIKLGARILAVADAYDAMVSERPYRKAFPKEKAIEELRKCSGTQFDAKVVDAFLKVLSRID